MRRDIALAVLLVGAVCLLAVPSLADDTSGETVVIAVQDDDAMLGASASDDVVFVAEDGLTAAETQMLSQRMQHGDLENAILIGSDISAIEDDVQDLGLRIRDRIDGEKLLYNAALQEWDSSSSVLVTSADDYATASVALQNLDAPVLTDNLSEDDIQSVLSYLDAQTIYVTGSVDESLQSSLNDSYTVTETLPGSVSLNQSAEQLSVELFDSNTDVAAVTGDEYVESAGQIGETLVVEDGDLGSTAQTKLQGVSEVYVLGDIDIDVDNQTQISDNINLRSNLVDYEYGLLVSHVSADGGGDYTVEIENIGFGAVPVVDETSVTASWTGLITNSSPSGETAGDEYRVTNNERMEPGDVFSVSLQTEQVDNGGHPSLDYYLETADGSFLGSGDTDLGLPFVDYTPSLWGILAFAAAAGLLAYFAALQARQYFET